MTARNNQNRLSVSRRDFLGQLGFVAASAAVGAPLVRANAAEPARGFPIIGFSKPFQQLNPADTADLVAEIGWDGIECPVRAKGQIEPAKVEEQLPAFVETFKKRGLAIPLITTDVEDATNPLGQKVLRTASRLGIKRYRLKHAYYQMDRPIPQQLAEYQARMRDLAQLNRELGIQGGLQNHSGGRYIGAPVWDIWHVIKDIDPQNLGICFDIGHATLEGGYSWPIEAKLMEPFYTVICVKDFFWQKKNNRWIAEWCPLGQGMVTRAFFDTLKKSSYAGPISQHHEYELGDRKAMVKAMQEDLKVLKGWLASASN